MLKHFPLSFGKRERLFLYTKGKELSLNGKEYIGEYHIIGGNVKTGPTETADSLILQPYYINADHYIYDNAIAKNPDATFVKAFADPVPFKIKPTENDYKQGTIFRFFAKNRLYSDAFVTEISERQYDNAGNDKILGNINPAIYNLLRISWRLVGYKKEVTDINTQTLVTANKQMPGIWYAVPDVLEFYI